MNLNCKTTENLQIVYKLQLIKPILEDIGYILYSFVFLNTLFG